MPVTSLAYISQSHQNLLLSGQGPIIRVVSTAGKDLLAQAQVFEFQSIHGIKARDAWENQSHLGTFSLLIWGGRRLAFGRINSASPGSAGQYTTSALAIGPELETADWILDASFDSSTHSPTVAWLVTAHNEVFAITLDPSRDLNIIISQVASGPSSILYSAHIKPISTTTILVAAGTVFGEVIVWSCYRPRSTIAEVETKWQSRTSKVFRGHNGSIFGVCLSNNMDVVGDCHSRRLLASCSDDRTLRIWDVSDCDNVSISDTHQNGQRPRNIPQTGLGRTADASVATTWCHSSRIWGVGFLDLGSGSSASLWRVVSRGEDATCQLWELFWDEPVSSDRADLGDRPLRLNHASIDHYHSGKHIWSHAQHVGQSTPVLVTGGSDGRIIGRSVPSEKVEGFCSSINMPLRDVFGTIKPGLTRDEDLRTDDHHSVKQYVFVSDAVIFATTSYGYVIKGTIEADEQNSCRSLNINWTVPFNTTKLRTLAVMTSNTREGLVYLASTIGDIWMYQHTQQSIQFLATMNQKISKMLTGASSTSKENITVHHLLVCSTSPLSAELLQITQSTGEPSNLRIAETMKISLPPTFQPTAFLEVSEASIFVLGSRSGALAVYHMVSYQIEKADQNAPALCVRHVHESDSITSLQCLPPRNVSEQHGPQWQILSTGRDGSYAIHQISFQSQEAKTITPIVTTLHRSRPPFNPNVEGCNIITTDSGITELLLYGFSGKNFVAWNESTHSEVMNIPCGGAHRSWAYFSTEWNSHLPVTGQYRCFVWTKAGVFNMAKSGSPAHEIIQPGGHGREIKAIALLKDIVSPNDTNGPTRRLIATGAEDTDVRLWLVTSSIENAHIETPSMNAKDSVSCMRILRKHTTGIQHLSFCQDFLFSSAGCEELFIWKINFGVGVVEIGTAFQAALPKHATASDLRITSFLVTHIPSGQQADSRSAVEHFLIYAAYSNSMIRAFKYINSQTLSPESRFELLGEYFYNTTCLTNVRRLSGCLSWFLAASTNGAVTIWPEVDHRVNNDSPAQLSHVAEHYIHQNAILALQTIRIETEYHLLFTGGDDNALGITLVYESAAKSILYDKAGEHNSLPVPRLRTLLIPRAHAAAITALEILDSKKKGGLVIVTVVSTGNDQRLKIWRITVSVDELLQTTNRPGMSGDTFGPEVVRAIDVRSIREMWTSVADISTMIIIPDSDDKDAAGGVDVVEADSRKGKRLMVAGIGMEMIRIGVADEND